jgi:hypothetical protein
MKSNGGSPNIFGRLGEKPLVLQILFFVVVGLGIALQQFLFPRKRWDHDV